jgi:hypothetical protein
MPMHIPVALCIKVCIVLAQVMTGIVWKIVDTLNRDCMEDSGYSEQGLYGR